MTISTSVFYQWDSYSARFESLVWNLSKWQQKEFSCFLSRHAKNTLWWGPTYAEEFLTSGHETSNERPLNVQDFLRTFVWRPVSDALQTIRSRREVLSHQRFLSIVFNLYWGHLCLIRSFFRQYKNIVPFYKGNTHLYQCWCLNGCYVLHHNTFFNLSDHITQFVKREFKGSSAAGNVWCGRTKTSFRVNCIGNLQEQLIQDMKN